MPSTYVAYDKILHISVISQAISPSSNNNVNSAIQIANKNDVLISYDTNLRFKLWSLELTRETIQKTIPFSDFLFPSLEDSIILSELTEQTDIVEYYLKIGAKLVALKLGSEDVLVANIDSCHKFNGKVVETVDAN